MKALTLWQPWASLVADGVKSVETRSWSTTYRGPLAIHASARKPGTWWSDRRSDILANRLGDPWFDESENYCEFVESADGGHHGYEWVGVLGAVVATCELIGIVPVEALRWVPNGYDSAAWWRDEWVNVPRAQEPYGDFTLGRFAWLLGNIVKLRPPIPAKGHQQLWNWEAP